MPYRTFLAWNVASAVLWGTFHVGIGYLAGPSWQTIDRYFKYGGFVLLGLVALGVGIYFVVRRHRQHRRAAKS